MVAVYLLTRCLDGNLRIMMMVVVVVTMILVRSILNQ